MKRANYSGSRRLKTLIGVCLLTGLLLSCIRAGNDASETSSAQVDGNDSTLTGPDLACNTPTHTAEVIWNDGDPQLTFASNSETIFNQVGPVAVLSNDDGSRTYGYRDDRAVFTRFYLDGTCLIQVLDSEDNVTVEAFGRTSSVSAERDVSAFPTDSESISAASNLDASPEASPIPSPVASPNLNPEAENDDAMIAAGPAPNELSMYCSGVIQDEVDFTAYFNNDIGFSRVEFLPRSSDSQEPLTSTLSYSGKNSAGQSLWRGSVSAMADVTLVHLSTTAAKPGDRISVGYDGRWGQAICQ